MSIPYGSLRFLPVFTAHIFTTERRSERRGFNTEITENTEEEEKENALRAAKNLCVLCVGNPFSYLFSSHRLTVSVVNPFSWRRAKKNALAHLHRKPSRLFKGKRMRALVLLKIVNTQT